MSDLLRKAAIRISYDGREFYGWQRHPGRRTVQGTLEEAVHACFGLETPIEGSGRTDRGTHALGQVATFMLPPAVSIHAAGAELNAALPDDVVVRDVREVEEGFHARHSAVGKTYRYVLWNADELPPDRGGRVWHVHGILDVAAMKRSLPCLLGERDFASFASSAGFQRASTVREMTRCELRSNAPEIELVFEANGFLYKMVRNLVRAIVKVGEGRMQPRDLERALAARSREAAPGAAPASGLFLDAVHYEPALFAD